MKNFRTFPIIFGLLLIYFFIFWKVECKNDFIEPILSLLKNLNYPVKITVLMCWKLSITNNFITLQNNYLKNFLATRSKFIRTFFNLKDGRNFQIAIKESSIENFPKVLNENQQLIIVDLDCNTTRKLLKDVGNRITHRFKWIGLSDSKNFEDRELKKYFDNLPILPNSEFYCILKKDNENDSLHSEKSVKYSIIQVYRPSLAQNLLIEPFGIFQNSNLLIQQKDKDAAIRRRNLQGTKLRASLVITNNNTVEHLTDYRNRHIDTISKVCYFLTNYLSDYVNASLEYKFVDSWGYKNDNTDEWSGMIGDLTENRSDIGASALFYTADRIKYIEYIAMPTPTRSKFVFRSPKLSYTDNVYILPFDRFVWFSLFGLMIVISIVLLLVSWLEFKLGINENDMDDSDASVLQPSFLDVAFLVFGATCQQGSTVVPVCFTARLIVMLIFTTLMFLYTSYSANIVALLQSPSNKIQTLEDLLNSRLKLAADDTVFNHYYFRHAVEPIRKTIYEQKIRNRDGTENFLPLADGVEKIREGLFAFHFETGVGYKILEELFLEDEKCGLQEIQYLQVVDPWYSIQKNSSFKELFKVGMMRIHEHGLQERENFALYTRKPKCVSGGGKFITASLVDTKPTLLVLLWGYVAALIILLIERVFYKIQLRSRNFVKKLKFPKTIQ